jgi:surface antigen
MPARALAALVLVLSAMAVPAAAGAAGIGGSLKGSPFAGFTADDAAMFLRTARLLATSKADGEELRWANDASGAWGTLSVKRTFKRRGATCRDVRGDATVKGRTEPFRLVLCRRPQEDWRIASSGPAPRSG